MDVCGHCGHNVANTETALCDSCGEDFWVQPQDFDDEHLMDYVKNAFHNLNIDYFDLMKIVCEDDKELYDKLLKQKVDK